MSNYFKKLFGYDFDNLTWIRKVYYFQHTNHSPLLDLYIESLYFMLVCVLLLSYLTFLVFGILTLNRYLLDDLLLTHLAYQCYELLFTLFLILFFFLFFLIRLANIPFSYWHVSLLLSELSCIELCLLYLWLFFISMYIFFGIS